MMALLAFGEGCPILTIYSQDRIQLEGGDKMQTIHKEE